MPIADAQGLAFRGLPLAMTVVTLRPAIQFGGERRPSPTEIEAMHHEAHERCFIAQSVKTEVCCEPIFSKAEANLSR